MYWIFANELEDEDHDAYISGTINEEVGRELSFKGGKAVGVPVPTLVLALTPASRPGRMTDHLVIQETTGAVFSSRLRMLLAGLGVDNLQYFDLEIYNPQDGSRLTDYKVANIIGLADCVDTERSELKYWDNGNIKRVRKLVLDESRIPPDLKIFRLAKRRILKVVHDSIRTAILDAGITGCVFYKPEDYR